MRLGKCVGVWLALHIGVVHALPSYKLLSDAVPTYTVPYHPDGEVLPNVEDEDPLDKLIPADDPIRILKGEVKRLKNELSRLTAPDNTPYNNLEHVIDNLMLSYAALESYANRPLAEPPMLNIVLQSKEGTLCALFRDSDIAAEPKPIIPQACQPAIAERTQLLKKATDFNCDSKGALYYSPELKIFGCLTIRDTMLALKMQIKPSDTQLQVEFAFARQSVPGFIGTDQSIRNGIRHIRTKFRETEVPTEKAGLQEWLERWDKAAESVAGAAVGTATDTFLSPTSVKVFVLTEAAQMGRLPMEAIYDYLPIDSTDAAHRSFLKFEKQRSESLSNANVQVVNNPNLKLLVQAPFPEIGEPTEKLD